MTTKRRRKSKSPWSMHLYKMPLREGKASITFSDTRACSQIKVTSTIFGYLTCTLWCKVRLWGQGFLAIVGQCKGRAGVLGYGKDRDKFRSNCKCKEALEMMPYRFQVKSGLFWAGYFQSIRSALKSYSATKLNSYLQRSDISTSCKQSSYLIKRYFISLNSILAIRNSFSEAK